ncbi:MAG: polymorphic toxin-type HINT domain-containing protein [Bacteroidota bacterium]
MIIRFLSPLFLALLFCCPIMANNSPTGAVFESKVPGLLRFDYQSIRETQDLQVRFTIKDTQRKTAEVQLRLTITGAGIKIQTSEQFQAKSILVTCNEPVILSGSDLAEYFNPRHLNFAGISKAQLLKNGQLPEGDYTICVEVLEEKRWNQIQLHQQICTEESLAENDPPVLLHPTKAINEVQPQFYNFTWQPRHLGAVLVEYELFIYEKVNGLSEQQTTTITAPIFRTKTFASSYLYKPSDPLLKTNQEYLVVVQVKDVKGQIYFKNNGKSKVESFSIIPKCIPGTTCDDGLACTYDDKIGVHCDCQGTPYYDPNEDGICDVLRLPAPRMVYPNEQENCLSDDAFTVLWDKQHTYPLDVDYHFYVWQKGVNATQTKAYQDLQNRLQQSRSQFVTEQQSQTQYFDQEQQIALQNFQAQAKTNQEACTQKWMQAQIAVESQQAQAQRQFEENLQIIATHCESDPQIAKQLFTEQLSREQKTLDQFLQKQKQRFQATQAKDLAIFAEQATNREDNFQLLQQEEWKQFMAKIKDQSQQTCSDHENFALTFESRKTALQAERQACLDDADQFRARIKKIAKAKLNQHQDEISTLKLAIQLAKQRYQELLIQLEGKMVQNKKVAIDDTQQTQVQNDYQQALQEAQANHEKILQTLEQRIEDHKTQQTKIKAERKQQLSHAQQHIQDLKKECHHTYQKALDQMEAQLTNREVHLEKALEIVRQDSIIFTLEQAEQASNFAEQNRQQAEDFAQQQWQEQQNFQQEIQEVKSQFNQLIEERKMTFEDHDCIQLTEQQSKLYERQQDLLQAYSFNNFEIEKEKCTTQNLDWINNFRKQQDAEKQILRREHDKQIQQFDGRQNIQRQHLTSDLVAAHQEAKLVFSGHTKHLFQSITAQDLQFEEGKIYELQVRAIDTRQVAQFDQEGWSERWPLHLKNCIPQNIEPPLALHPSAISSQSFTAQWTAVEGVEQYLLEVATDNTFSTLIPGHSGLLVKGTTQRCPLTSGHYCYRLRSVKDGTISTYSNTICSSPPESCMVGTPCDDSDPCTYNDIYSGDCACVGTDHDADGDGVCDGLDQCPNGDDQIDFDNDNVPDFCDDCVVGTPCDDGNPLTVLDTYLINPELIYPNQPPPPGVAYCLCQGTAKDELTCQSDADGDGVCDEYDTCPGGDDMLDDDQDGVANHCDQCPGFDDLKDTDGDGIPDGCDANCDDGNSLILCPELVNCQENIGPLVEKCDYSVILDRRCKTNYITVTVPGQMTSQILNAQTPNFSFPYCNDNEICNNSSNLIDLANDLNVWLSINGYCGTVTVKTKSTDPYEIHLDITKTEVTFHKIQQQCKNSLQSLVFKKLKCVMEEKPIQPVTQKCDVYVDLPSKCYLSNLKLFPPNGNILQTIDKYNAQNIFAFPYCTVPNKACNGGEDIAKLVGHIDQWLAAKGYCGKAEISYKKGDKTLRLKINQTDVKFFSAQTDCKGLKVSYGFVVENCVELVEEQCLVIQAINTGNCEQADYLWSNGATTSSIEVGASEDPNAYSVTVTCADNCAYLSQQDYACEVGKSCDDYDPCTINDQYNACCECRGEYQGDADNDGVCDPIDVCPGLDDNEMPDDNNDGIPDDCIDPCQIDKPCDDGDVCTIDDRYQWVSVDGKNVCTCIGEGPIDSDGDFVCDALDQCPGSPDFVDTDGDGIPDGCDSSICVDADGNELDYCDAIITLAECVRDLPAPADEPRLQNMKELSDFFYDFILNPNSGISGDITQDGTPLEDMSLEDLGFGDLNGANGTAFDIDLIVDPDNQEMADCDGDGVCDLFDICPGGDDKVDLNEDGIPDDCAGCNFSTSAACPPINLALYLQYKFDRTCEATIVQPNEETCLVPGEYDCACNCVPEGDYDLDGDGFCDENDDCIGGNNNFDADGDGIPNACDEDDPCEDVNTTCPPLGAECVIGGFIQYNDETGTCDCITLPDGDDDGDGICNSEDQCPGTYELIPDPDNPGEQIRQNLTGNDNDDIDGDGFPDDCDLCPEYAGAVSQACDDGNPCTINDAITYTYGTQLLSELIGTDMFALISDPLDLQEVVQVLQDNEPAPEEWADIYYNLEETFLQDGLYYATVITGCTCQGFEFDSDYDGVCDALDQCPDFDDHLDYDGDGIPDGCDQPYFEVGCPVSVSFLLDGNYFGIQLVYNDPDLDLAQIPNPLDFTFVNANLDALFILEQIEISNFQNHSSFTQVLYEIPELDPSQVYHEGGTPTFWGEIAYSNGQYCYIEDGRTKIDGESNTQLFGCPENGHYFSNDGYLAIGMPFTISSMINRNSVPTGIENINLSFSGVNTLSGSASITEENFITFGADNMLLMTTDIAIPTFPAGLIPLSNANGTIDYNNALSCEYLNGNIQLQCSDGEGNGVYIGQPCDDNNELTHLDRFVEISATECTCQGEIIHDLDGDGIHDTEDICPNGDDLIDTNGNNIPDACECDAPIVATTDYGDGSPVDLVMIENGNDLRIILEANSQHTGYQVTWTPDAPEEPLQVGGTEIDVSNLSPGQSYTIIITAHCNSGFPSDALEIPVNIPGAEFTCLDVSLNPPTNCTPLDHLFIGDVVMIGDFEVTIGDITSSSGDQFSGTGYAALPYLNFILVEYHFENITIQLCDGVYTVTDGEMYVPQHGNLEDILSDFIGDFNIFDGNLLDDIEMALSVLNNLIDEMEDSDDYYDNVHDLGGEISELLPEIPFMQQSLIDDLNAALDCMSAVPETETFASCQNILNDAVEAIIDHLTHLYDAEYQVLFYPNDEQDYGFDTQTYAIHASNYDQISAIAGESYSVPWKSVASGAVDEVNAKRNGNPEDVSNIVFKDTRDSTIYSTLLNGDNHKKVNALGRLEHGEIREVYAVQGIAEEHDHDGSAHIHLAGKVNVVSYDLNTVDLRIVPVNGISLPPFANVQQGLNKIYQQAVTEINLGDNYLTDFSPSDLPNPMPNLSSGLLSAYNDPMNDIIREFKDAYDTNNDTYYLFVLPVDILAPNDESNTLLGFMPKNRNYGFIAQGATSNPDLFIKTVAHELGHGAFHLEHTFETYPSNPQLALGEQTDNLMDYGETGTQLRKYQWDLIHDPTSNFTLFDDDLEGASVTVSNMAKLANFINDDGTYTFVAPSGKPITLPGEVTDVKFSTGDRLIGEGGICGDYFAIIPFGTLISFELNGQRYKLRFNCWEDLKQFTRYAYDDEAGDYVDEYTPTYTNLAARKAILGFPCIDPNISEGNNIIFDAKQFVIGTHLNLEGIAGATNYLGAGAMNTDDPTFLSVIDPTGHVQLKDDEIYLSYTLEARAFLNAVSEGGSDTDCDSPKLLLAFSHAQQIKTYPGFYRRCGDDYHPIRNYEVKLDPTLPLIADLLLKRYDRLITASLTLSSLITIEELDTWSDYGASIYELYANQYDEVWTPFWEDFALDEENNMDLEHAEALRDILISWEEKYCVLSALTRQQRLWALELFSLLDLDEQNFWNHDWPMFEYEEENLYNALLLTAPKEDYEAILNLFSAPDADGNAYALYYTVIDKLEDFVNTFDNRGYSTFATALADMVYKSRARDQYHEDGLYVSIDEEDYSYFYDVQRDVENQTKLTISSTQIGVDPISSQGYPFEYVEVRFKNNSAFSFSGANHGQNFRAGDKVIVPIVFADWLFRKYEGANFDLRSRQAANYIVIVLATLATLEAGGSGGIAVSAVISGAYAATDLLVMAEDEYLLDLTGNSYFTEEQHMIWTVLGIIPSTLSVGQYNSISVFRTLGAGFRFTMQNTKNLALHLISAYPTSYKFKIAQQINWMKGAKGAIELGGIYSDAKSFYSVAEILSSLGVPEPQNGDSPEELSAIKVNVTDLLKRMELEIYGLELLKSFSNPPESEDEDLIHFNLTMDEDLNIHFNYLGLDFNNVLKIVDIQDEVPRIAVGSNSVWYPVGAGIANLDPVVFLEGVHYQDDLGDAFGNVDIYFDGDANQFIFIPQEPFTGLASQFHQFFNLFLEQGWIPIDEMDPNSDLSQDFATLFSGIEGFLADASQEERDALVEIMRDWNIIHFNDLQNVLSSFSETDPFTSYIKNNVAHAFEAIRVLKAGDSQLIDNNNHREDAIERMVEDLSEHYNFADFLSGNNKVKMWDLLNKSDGVGHTKLTEWFEDLWLEDKLSMDIDVNFTLLRVRLTVNDNPDPVAKINFSGSVNTAFEDDVGEGPIMGDDIVYTTEDGVYAIVKNDELGTAACRSGACFPADTKVFLADGCSKAIEEVQAGDFVTAWDGAQQDTVHAKVVRTMKKTWNRLVKIATKKQSIFATGNHPFYVPELGKYVSADSLRSGMNLLLFTGALLAVNQVEAVDTSVEVYNFEVAHYHNYFVGEHPVLVHNDCNIDASLITDEIFDAVFPLANNPEDPAEGAFTTGQREEIESQLEESIGGPGSTIHQFFIDYLPSDPTERTAMLINRLEIWYLAQVFELPANQYLLNYLTSISQKTMADNQLVDMYRLMDNGFAAVLNSPSLSEEEALEMLYRINENWSGQLVEDLARRLGKEEYAGLGQALSDDYLHSFDIYNQIVLEPANARAFIERFKDQPDWVEPNWMERAGRSAFFNNALQLGNAFEDFIQDKLVNDISVIEDVLSAYGYYNLDGFSVYNQVLMYNYAPGPGGDYFIADFLLIKEPDGGFPGYPEVIIIESKLNASTAFTCPQNRALGHVENGISSLWVGSYNKQDLLHPGNSDFALSYGRELIIDPNYFFKIYSDGNYDNEPPYDGTPPSDFTIGGAEVGVYNPNSCQE